MTTSAALGYYEEIHTVVVSNEKNQEPVYGYKFLTPSEAREAGRRLIEMAKAMKEDV